MDLIALEEHFGEELTPCYDRLGGDGLEVQVNRGQGRRPLLLQVFPDTQVARVSTGLSDLTLRQARIAVDDAHDVLELQGTTDEEWARARIERSGTLIFASVPQRRDGASPEDRPSAPGLSEGAIRGEEGEIPEQVVDDKRGEQPARAPNRLEQERVNLVGRVGTEPRFRTTKNDKLVCNFPLAVHLEDGSTKWHDIVTFGERAVKLQDSLHKGQEIEVIGYIHTKQVQGKDGAPKEKREVWAAVVRKPKTTSPS